MSPANDKQLPPGATHSRRAAILMLAGFAATYLDAPGNLVSLVALVPAVVESVRALLEIRRAPSSGGPTVWTALGLALSVMMIMVVALPYLFYPSTSDYRECMGGANTAAAEVRCEDLLDDDVSWVQQLTNR